MTTAAKLPAPSLPLPIQAIPHWRVRIGPEEYRTARLPSPSDCRAVAERAQVGRRGWPYPYVETEPRHDGAPIEGSSWAGSWTDWSGYREYWRLYQSGQFIHLLGFREDAPADKEQLAMWWKTVVRGVPPGFEPNGYMDFVGLLYTLSEVHLFARNLAIPGVLGERLWIEIGMDHVLNRVLFSADSKRTWHEFAAATCETLRRPAVRLSVNDLAADVITPAVDAAIWFYERFGVENAERFRILLRDEALAFTARR